MKKISTKTVITALVNYKCVGIFGKCFRSFTLSEKRKAISIMIENGWIEDENNIVITKIGNSVIKDNINLLQY